MSKWKYSCGDVANNRKDFVYNGQYLLKQLLLYLAL